MDLSDTVVSIHTYFKIEEENLIAFKKLSVDLIETTRGEMGCMFYSVSYAKGEACFREGYKDAESLVAHLDNAQDLLQRINSVAVLLELEVHAPSDEIAKLREWPSMKHLDPQYYIMEGGFRS